MHHLIKNELNEFERAIAAEVRSDVAFIDAIGSDLVTAGGKRLRPSLAFLTRAMLGADTDQALRVALAVELLHSASLLHDDLIDDADSRRGAEAAFRRYGSVVSVMSGDYLLARVLAILARSGHSGFTGLMAETAAAVCEGEVLQFQSASLQDRSVEGYFRIVDGKTGALFVAATVGVGMLAGASEAQLAALRTFAIAFGRAFQLRDDVLDLLGDPKRLGKPVGGDLREGKATYPVLLLLEAGVTEPQAILDRHASVPGDLEAMIALVREHGADRRSLERIDAEANAAVSALSAFAPSPAREALADMALGESVRVA